MTEPEIVTPVGFITGIEACTQKQLSERTGVSTGSLSRAANGIAGLNPKAEHRLARATGYPDGFFTRQIRVIAPKDLTFRATTKTSVRTIRSVSDEWSALSTTASILWETLGASPPDWVKAIAPKGESLSRDQIELAAARTRHALGLPTAGPIGNLTLAIEKSGIVVAPQRSLRHKDWDTRLSSDGVTCPQLPESGFAPAIGYADDATGDRDRFTKAHELGHIVLQRRRRPASHRDREAEAHMFASALLMPAADARLLIGDRTMLSDFLRLKSEWGMSVAALITRGRTAGCYGEDRATSLYMQLNMRRWRRREPVEVPKEAPSLLAVMATRAFGQGTDGDEVSQTETEDRLLLPHGFLDQWTGHRIKWSEPGDAYFAWPDDSGKANEERKDGR